MKRLLFVLLILSVAGVLLAGEPFHGGPGPRPGPGPMPGPGPHVQPMPQPGPRPMPMPPTPYGGFHDQRRDYGRYDHRGPGPIYNVNPWNIIAPIIVNYGTAARYVPNPISQQMELRTPGRWAQHSDGSWSYDALPFWPPGATGVPQAVGAGPTTANQPATAKRKFRPVRWILRHIL